MTRSRSLVILVGLILVGFAIRIYQLGYFDYRGDEIFTVNYWAGQPLLETLASDLPASDPQPALAYALYNVWGGIFGTGEIAMRLFPALVNLLGIPAAYALGRLIHSRRLGLLAALIWTLHPFEIWHAQDARNYAIWASLSIIALWLALRLLKYQRRIDYILFIIAGAASAYVYYLELFIFATLTLYVLIVYWRKWLVIGKWFAALFVIGLMLAPWYLQPRLLTGSGYGGTAGGFDAAQLLTVFIPSLMFGRTLPADLMAPLSIMLLVILVLGIVFLWQRNRQYAILLALLSTLPLAMLSIVSLRLNVFTPRYVLAVAPVYGLLFGACIIGLSDSLRQPLLRRVIPLALLAGWMVISIYSLNNYFTEADYAKAPRWSELTDYLHSVVGENDLMIQAAADEAFTYYYEDFTEMVRLPANPNQSEDIITGYLEENVDQYDSLWLVAPSPPGWFNRNIAPDWLLENTQLIRETTIGGLPVRQFMSWSVDESEIAAEPLATFANTVQLVGVQTLEPTDEQRIILVYWHPLATTNNGLKVFMHLTPLDNPVPIAQDDQFPQDGRISTTTWAPGTFYRDVYHIPMNDVVPGEYRLFIGLYDPTINERLLTDQGEDSYWIETITVD